MNIRKQFFSLKNLTIDTSLENDNFKYPLNIILQQVWDLWKLDADISGYPVKNIKEKSSPQPRMIQ